MQEDLNWSPCVVSVLIRFQHCHALIRRQCADIEERTLAIFADAPGGFAREVGVGQVGKEFLNEGEGVTFELFHVPVGVSILSAESFKGFGRSGFARLGKCGDWFAASENISKKAFDWEFWEGSAHGSEVTDRLHCDLETIEEVLRKDGSGFVIDDVERAVDLCEHVDNAGPFDFNREVSLALSDFFPFS